MDFGEVFFEIEEDPRRLRDGDGSGAPLELKARWAERRSEIR